ncbi:hypothetical protein AVEN_66743-1 [Araneus ventricosus]|uniref:Integrase catalytic domain-containing protein n=1 Tax=Araneus ventricosus TaxID=182803 RepID=A0A4Y2HS87_ARAVE|nr:hypothetical protein AVEN_66743-1 [Araneus ventricosus]
MWTDSEICLHWITSSDTEWKQFVSNRVVEIQDCVVPDRWFHCPGLENPADRLTRGVSAVSLKSDDLWWSGPRWLKSPRYDWPQQKFRVPDEYMQEKRIVVHTAIVKDDPLIDISRFSSLTRLLRVTAYVLRFLGKLGGKSTQTGPLVATEINEAEEFWVKQVQREHFDFEITRLNRGQQIPAVSRIWSLTPYLQEGLLCVKGRLEQSELTQEEKHPILLPRSKYTDLLILHEHNRGFHLDVIATLSRLRERFWIPKGRQSVKSVLKSCLVCRKYSAKPARQQTGQLPQDRVVPCPPFTTVGTDFTGAITVKTTGGALQKMYIVLFTCAVTRAVHLEVVSNMSVKSFIMSLRRFLARRGCVKVFYSDNAKTFRSSCEILKGFKSIIRQPELKRAYHGSLFQSDLHGGEVSENEIESVINNRPITYDSDELDEPRALTSSHFLLPGHRNTGFVPEYFLDLFVSASDRVTLSRRKLFQTKLLKQLWVKWKEQYLLMLKSAHNLANTSSYNNLKIGDVVLVEGASKSKLLWEMGVIHEVIMGRHGFVRACVVKTSKGKRRRAVQLMYPLEI